MVLLTSAAFRSSVGVLVIPFEEEFGWSRSTTSIAVALNLVLYGLAAPFATALMERLGIRNVAVGALGLIAIGTGLTTIMTEPWHLVLLWGVVVGLGVGATALVFGSLVVTRWFVRHQGLMLGVMGAAWATGQLIFLPIIAHYVSAEGWRVASVGIAGVALCMIPIVWLVIRDRPSDVGQLPYGADPTSPPSLEKNVDDSIFKTLASSITTLSRVAHNRSFWILSGTFFVCGWTTNGIISTHFIPAAQDEGMAVTAAATLLAVVGIFDLVGTIGSGWLTDRFDPRKLLAIYYGLRGIALLAMPLILGPSIEPPMLIVMVLFGLDWVATVPPTAILSVRIFGKSTGIAVFAWVFASHMIGAAAAALLSGFIRDISNDYLIAWLLAGVLALLASAAALALPKTQFEAPED
tara:strand:- start:2060 stop:3283 length:1224 start_codon:yes stop_codon:yes gene_type:complete